MLIGTSAVGAAVRFFSLNGAETMRFTEVATNLGFPVIGMGLTNPQTNFHIFESNTSKLPALEIEQGGDGDAALQFSIVGDAYAIGIDNLDGDKFKISYNAVAGFICLHLAHTLGINSSTCLSSFLSFIKPLFLNSLLSTSSMP